MDTYHEIDTIKLEKLKAMQRYRTFNKIANIIRMLEIIVAISFISYSISFGSSYLPALFELADKFLRRLSSLIFSPHFVFVIGNIIIVTLFAKSSSEKTSFTSNNAGEEIFGEVETVVAESPVVVKEVPAVEVREKEEKIYRRTKSAGEIVVVKEDEKKVLQRSETQIRRKIENTEKNPVILRRKGRTFEEDELSNEEFRRKVEAFIERQQKFLREEKLAVIVSN
ncbi:uncharacterized protein LOC130810719 [Amaranthus tricolor]|uniref:uncharacterized protein LOC130810719 n=1 Tax=Amaranthus tricolor TaxID=29722 RepID=UPI00258282DC|nr:uncharacterized protein LOC130810719 [Amaranthus tricolor]